MTLRPHGNRVRFEAERPTLRDLGPCVVPRCTRPATERHHIWSRRQLGKPADVVRDRDTGVRIPNLAAVCSEHHKDLTGRLGGHLARIVWDEDEHVLLWDDGSVVRPLDPQPRLAGSSG